MTERDERARSFDEMYEGTPPWDIGRPQPAVVDLLEAGGFEGRVLDAGCGTGEHALLLAEAGHDVVGVDVAPRALARARAKADARGLADRVRFVEHDALELARLDGGRFDTVLDVGLLHVFPDEDRARYVAGLAKVVRPGGRVHVLCFSDREPADWGGPRRVREDELRAAFADGWAVEALEPTRFATRVHDAAAGHAWRATFRRTP